MNLQQLLDIEVLLPEMVNADYVTFIEYDFDTGDPSLKTMININMGNTLLYVELDHIDLLGKLETVLIDSIDCTMETYLINLLNILDFDMYKGNDYYVKNGCDLDWFRNRYYNTFRVLPKKSYLENNH